MSRRVAVHLGAGVAEQDLAVPLRPLGLVVERRAVRVEGDDGGVGERALGGAHRGEVGVVHLHLRGARSRRPPGPPGGPRAHDRRPLRRVDLPGVLVAAGPVEAGHELLRVRRQPRRLRPLALAADEGRASRAAQGLPDRVQGPCLLDVELRHPEGLAHPALLVPVVLGGVADHPGPLPRDHVEQVVGSGERTPVGEVGGRLEGRVPVVDEVREGCSARDHEGVEARLVEPLRRLRLETRDVLREEMPFVHCRRLSRSPCVSG